MINFLKEVFKPIKEGDNITSHFIAGIAFVIIVATIVCVTAIFYAGFSSTAQINAERRMAMQKLYSERGR